MTGKRQKAGCNLDGSTMRKHGPRLTKYALIGHECITPQQQISACICRCSTTAPHDQATCLYRYLLVSRIRASKCNVYTLAWLAGTPTMLISCDAAQRTLVNGLCLWMLQLPHGLPRVRDGCSAQADLTIIHHKGLLRGDGSLRLLKVHLQHMHIWNTDSRPAGHPAYSAVSTTFGSGM